MTTKDARRIGLSKRHVQVEEKDKRRKEGVIREKNIKEANETKIMI